MILAKYWAVSYLTPKAIGCIKKAAMLWYSLGRFLHLLHVCGLQKPGVICLYMLLEKTYIYTHLSIYLDKYVAYICLHL